MSLADTIDIERDGLRDILEAVAVMRETDAKAERDHRYAEAARSIRLIASTLHQVDDANCRCSQARRNSSRCSRQ